MIISLIGMSGTGKSSWAKRLEAELNFSCFSCDNLIARQLAHDIQHCDVHRLGEWLGLPNDPDYQQRERLYLDLEEHVLAGILDQIESAANKTDVVIDTTGSVIYCSDQLLKRLRSISQVIHLAISDQTKQTLLDRYLKYPKPVIWNGIFNPLPDEPEQETIERCYPMLIDSRLASYHKLAHIDLEPGSYLRDILSSEQLLGMIKSRCVS